MAWYNFWKSKLQATSSPAPQSQTPPLPSKAPVKKSADPLVRRHFYNERGFQTYASFFQMWDGWVTAGHCLTESKHLTPPFASGQVHCHPGGLDAAVIGCKLPKQCPASPYAGQEVLCIGYPAGSSEPAKRRGKTYIQRPGADGTWIAHIISPDEPVVSGMSGGAVIDAASGTPIGIIITRNSPADLNNDRDPDESCDFIALSDVWHAVKDLEGLA